MNLDCPKSMTFGPCGGVTDAGCEVDRRPCPFLGPDHRRLLAREAGRRQSVTVPLAEPWPVLVVDVRAPSDWRGDAGRIWRCAASHLRGCVALLGEHVDNRRHHGDAGPSDATTAIEILSSHGIRVIATVTGRDRDTVAAAATMRRLKSAGAVAIHCVTGDHPAGLSIDRPAWFAAESVSLIGIANELGLAAIVAESPSSPGPRVERVGLKARSGAALCILNHGGDARQLAGFVERCRHSDIDLPFIAPIPMVGDAAAAASLAKLPGLNPPDGYLSAIIAAADPLTTGIERAGALAAELAATRRFVGLNLSGATAGADPFQRLELTSRFIDAARTAFVAATNIEATGLTSSRHGEDAATP